MKMDASGARVMFAVAGCLCLSEFAVAQVFPNQLVPNQSFQGPTGFGVVKGFASATVTDGQGDGAYKGNYPPTGAQSQQRSFTSASGSRSATFMKNGKRVSVAETAAGITVSVDGQTVRATDANELKKRYPDAYRLYDDGLKGTRVSARAFASGSANANAGSGQSGFPGQFQTSSTQNRSVSVVENGKRISITENPSGITVSVNGRRVRTKDVSKLKKRFPEAFEAYEQHMGAGQRNARPLDATALLQQELTKLRDQNTGNPQLRGVIERLMDTTFRDETLRPPKR
ncbi:MAG: hypothetical protein AAFU85_02755 [Planctomycetota bacterium]